MCDMMSDRSDTCGLYVNDASEEINVKILTLSDVMSVACLRANVAHHRMKQFVGNI